MASWFTLSFGSKGALVCYIAVFGSAGTTPILVETLRECRGKWNLSFRNAHLFIILFVRNFWRVYSQFWLSVRNSVWGPFNRKSRGNPSLCWLGRGGGSRGTVKGHKNFVNKLAFPIHVGSHQLRESLRELLRELWFSYCSSHEMPFRERNFAFRESVSEFRELLRECPGTLRELREWPSHSESVFPEIGVVPRLLMFSFPYPRLIFNVSCLFASGLLLLQFFVCCSAHTICPKTITLQHLIVISGLQKGPAERGHVKKRQKASKSFSTLFDNFRAGPKTSKIVSKSVKKFFNTFRQFFRAGHLFFPAPFAIRWLLDNSFFEHLNLQTPSQRLSLNSFWVPSFLQWIWIWFPYPNQSRFLVEGDATKHFSVKKRGFQWKGGRQFSESGVWWGFLQERQFSEEVRAIHWTAGLWKLKSCCPHPLPENRLLPNLWWLGPLREINIWRHNVLLHLRNRKQTNSVIVLGQMVLSLHACGACLMFVVLVVVVLSLLVIF